MTYDSAHTGMPSWKSDFLRSGERKEGLWPEKSRTSSGKTGASLLPRYFRNSRNRQERKHEYRNSNVPGRLTRNDHRNRQDGQVRRRRRHRSSAAKPSSSSPPFPPPKSRRARTGSRSRSNTRKRPPPPGDFPGGYFKREGRPTEKEILTCRMTDRPLRPLFPKGYLYDTQIVALLLSADGENDSDILEHQRRLRRALRLRHPLRRPDRRGARRPRQWPVRRQSDPRPARGERSRPRLRRHRDKVIMIEGGGKELPDAKFIKALDFAQTGDPAILDAQEELARRVGKPKRKVASARRPGRTARRSPTTSPATASRTPSTNPQSRPRQGRRRSREEVETKIKAKYPDAGRLRNQPGFRLPAEESLPRQHPRQGRALRRPRHQHDPPAHRRSRRAAPRPRFRALFARGETQALLDRHPRAARREAEPRQLHRRRRQPNASSCTTTSRPSASAKPAASAA